MEKDIMQNKYCLGRSENERNCEIRTDLDRVI